MSVVAIKSKAFALRIVRLYQHLTQEKREFVLSKQLLRSGTSVGANIREAGYGQSRADFISKLSISLKEAAETEYWLELLHESGYLNDSEFSSIHRDCVELLKLLTSIINTAKDDKPSPNP